jgi:hypothetical protein
LIWNRDLDYDRLSLDLVIKVLIVNPF